MLQRGLLNLPSDPDLAQDTAQRALAGGRLEVWGLWTPGVKQPHHLWDLPSGPDFRTCWQ